MGSRVCFIATVLMVGGVCAAVGQVASPELPADCAAYASVPLPAEAETVPVPKETPSCASYRSYRGIGRPVNFAAARACAWRERLAGQNDLRESVKEPTAWFVGGPLILADIYFNGAGVKSNVPLAMRFACEAEENMVTLALPEIAKAKGTHAKEAFEFCDYAATTVTMNYCFSYENQVEDDRRSRFYDSLKTSMTSEQRAAFEKLLAAENAYVTTHRLEVYQGGTIRAVRTMGSESILKELFHTEVVQFERKEWPALSPAHIAKAGGLQHREYAKAMKQLAAQPKDDFYNEAVHAEGLSKVEKTWESYRDAWVTFARLRYPDEVDAIRAEIEMRRYLLLKTIGDGSL